MGAVASVVLGLLVFLGGDFFGSEATGTQSASVTALAPAAARVAAPEDPTLKKINATAKAMAAVAHLTDQERAERRVKAAKQVSEIVQVASAAWSTQSTLQVNMKQTDGADTDLISEVCRILTQYEELRFTRVQLDPPDTSNVPVRWRQCQ
jgi:hypothetical protein